MAVHATDNMLNTIIRARAPAHTAYMIAPACTAARAKIPNRDAKKKQIAKRARANSMLDTYGKPGTSPRLECRPDTRRVSIG